MAHVVHAPAPARFFDDRLFDVYVCGFVFLVLFFFLLQVCL
jgi:hypothetical protein